MGECTFLDCESLADITIPESITNISDRLFDNCTGLKNITIPNSVTSIGYSAFARCTGLTDVTIPNSVTSIGSSAFRNCTGLMTVAMPDSITTISSDLFSGCTGLTDITIPDGVTSIKDSAFENCTALNNIIIPNNVISIERAAFEGCTALESITIPDEVTSVGGSAFKNCTSLQYVVIPNNLTALGKDVFLNTPFYEACYNDEKNWENNAFYIGNYLITTKDDLTGECIIRNGTLAIADYAFNERTGLTSVTIPSSIVSIGMNAFFDCAGLTSLTIPDSVRIVDSGAFNRCSSLTSVVIPDGVREIGAQAFCHCNNLSDISLPDSLTEIGIRVFADTAYSNDERNWEDGALYISNHLISASNIPERYSVKDVTVCIAGEAFYWTNYWNKTVKTVIIPKSVKSICGNAFGEGSFMSDVYYGGSESDRESISIDYGNSLLENATWHYNYVPAEPVITLTSGHVKAENALYGMLIVSGYDKDGRLVKSEIIDGYESDLSGYYACKTLRAVLWSSTASMRPLTEAAVYQK